MDLGELARPGGMRGACWGGVGVELTRKFHTPSAPRSAAWGASSGCKNAPVELTRGLTRGFGPLVSRWRAGPKAPPKDQARVQMKARLADNIGRAGPTRSGTNEGTSGRQRRTCRADKV